MRDPLKGWTGKDTALADPFSIEQAAVGCAGFGLSFVEVVQAALAAQVVGVVDHGFDAQRAAVFQVLLDPGVLVENVDGDVDTAGDDLGFEDLRSGWGPAGPDPAACEDQFDLLRAAEVKVVGEEGFEEASGVAGLGEHDGARDLDLPHRQLHQ